MRRLALTVLLLAYSIAWPLISAATDLITPNPYTVPGSFVVLAYHEVRDEVRDYPDPYAVGSNALVSQFEWLRGNGYTVVNLDQVVAARQGGKPLPAKAVLLTFDDAYLSFYTRVYPLLREFHFSAVLGVVGKWIDDPQGGPVLYGEKNSVPDASFPTWGQLREMADSGLVELASHTYNLHHGVLANPQGNLQAAATTRIYDAATDSYENDADWRTRVRTDLAKNADVIERNTGHRPRAVVWPYGNYNDELVAITGELGMTIGLTLDDGANSPDVPLTSLRRALAEHNPTLTNFFYEMRGPLYAEPIRAVQISLDEVYSPDPAQQERNLSALLDRIKILKPSHVFLQATADTDGDGIADAAYFPTRHLPLRANLFDRVAWQLISRADVSVYAVMPVNSFHLSRNDVAEVYEDLARTASFSGLVFNDMMSDASTLEFTAQLAMRVRAFREPLKTVGMMTIDPSLTTAVSTQDAQRFSAYVANYDYVALAAATPVKNAEYSKTWFSSLLTGVGRTPGDADIRHKAIFMLNHDLAYSTRPELFPDDHMAWQMRTLQLGGLINFGYIYDDVLHNNPPLAQVAPAMSLRIYLR